MMKRVLVVPLSIAPMKKSFNFSSSSWFSCDESINSSLGMGCGSGSCADSCSSVMLESVLGSCLKGCMISDCFGQNFWLVASIPLALSVES